MRLLPVVSLQLAADQQVELLVGAAELDVRLKRHRVVALRERIEEFVDRDRLLGRVALGEIVALEHARHRVFRRELDHAVGAERHQPFGVERHLGLFAVEDQEHLVGVCTSVRLDFLTGQRGPRRIAARGVADHSGEIADEEDDMVAEILQLTKLVELDRVPEVEVRACRVEPLLDLQWLAARELAAELGFDQQLVGAALEDGDVVVDVERHGGCCVCARRRGCRTAEGCRDGPPGGAFARIDGHARPCFEPE